MRSRADLQAPWPGCVLTNLNSPRRTCRSGRPAQRPAAGRSRSFEGAHAPSRPRPCRASSCSICAMKPSPGWSNIRPKLSCPPSCAFRCAGLFARAGPRSERRVTRRRPRMGGRTRASVVTDATGPQPRPTDTHAPCGPQLPCRAPSAPPPVSHPRGVLPGRAVHHPGCPERRGKARMNHLQPQRRAPAPRTGLTGGEGRLRGSCCRVPVDVVVRTAWEGRRHGACLRHRSRVSPCPPAWCRVGAEARQGEVVCREHPGVPPSSRHLAAAGVRTVPRAED